MKKKFCEKCYTRNACVEPCKLIESELKAKGVYEYTKDPETKQKSLELQRKKEEVELVFMHDPYGDGINGICDDYTEESKP